jgi:hypothetical protein
LEKIDDRLGMGDGKKVSGTGDQHLRLRQAVRQQEVAIAVDLGDRDVGPLRGGFPGKHSLDRPKKETAVGLDELLQEGSRDGPEPSASDRQPCGDDRPGELAATPRDDVGQGSEGPPATWELIGRADAGNQDTRPGLEVGSHFQGHHPAHGNATHQTRSARVDNSGHAPGILRQGLARKSRDPIGQADAFQRGPLRFQEPRAGAHAGEQNQG